MSSKPLSCLFMPKVFCSFRKSTGFHMMHRCLKCRHYREFMREMAEEDEKVMDEIDRMREYAPDG